MEPSKALHTYDPVKGEWVEVQNLIMPKPASSPISEISWEEAKRHNNEDFLSKSSSSPDRLKKQATVTDVDSLDEKGYTDYVQKKIDALYDRDHDISALLITRPQSHVIKVSSALTHQDVKDEELKGYLAKKSPRFFVGWQVRLLLDSIRNASLCSKTESSLTTRMTRQPLSQMPFLKAL